MVKINREPREGSFLVVKKMKNIFYFREIHKIGGTEQFLYEIAKKYRDWDITIYYQKGDPRQLKRLKKYVRCKKWTPGEKIECDRAFFNFNIEIIDYVESKENYYAFVSHANYEELGYKPPIEHEKLNHFFGVSNFAARKLEEYGKKLGRDIKVETIYNPLGVEEAKKVPIIVSACRLDDEVKGGKRTLKLIEALDKYCREHERQYLWLIFTNHTDYELNSPNAIYMQPRIDVRPYIAMADWVAQLSNDMETYCYTTNEASSYGVPIITTPLSVYEELPKCERVVLEWDCSNVDEVARQIFEKEVKPFKYKPPEDTWNKHLAKGKSTYKEDKLKKTTLKFIGFPTFYAIEEGIELKNNETITVSEDRAEELMETKCFERC